MTDPNQKDTSLGESFEQLLQQNNYKKINSVLKQSLNSVLELTKKGIDFAYQKWGTSPKSLKPSENPKLVDRKAVLSRGGKDLADFGIAIDVIGGILLVLKLFTPLMANVSFYIFGIIIIIGGVLFNIGTLKHKRTIRLQKYLRELGSGTVATVHDLSITASTNEEQVLKDLQYFMGKDVLKEGRMVEGNSIFILDRGTYEIYKNKYLEGGNKRSLQEGTWEKEVDEDIKNLVLYSEGLDETMKIQINKIQERVQAILDYGVKHPESTQDLRKFSDYYLPTTLELVRRYRQFHLSNTEETNQAKEEIKESLQTVEEGFAALLDNLNTDLMMDTRSDISVMETLMKQEGLIDRDFSES
ncbi:MAG: 5-bromo-4-chloroindolyl phosphate hydrolysis family protein [Tissierellia bacterium]|nr:5-bromo-4-chloroindolyl phosphate hydrolysis family protein [Tissierellia bacterium]